MSKSIKYIEKDDHEDENNDSEDSDGDDILLVIINIYTSDNSEILTEFIENHQKYIRDWNKY